MPHKVLMTLGVRKPFDQLAQAMGSLEPGQLLQIVVDARELSPELASWCRDNGHHLMDVASAAERLVVTIRKGAC